MSMRTIVEFNHDYAHEIKTARAELAGWLSLALNSGNDEKYWDELRKYGIHKVVMTHHSDERKVVLKNGREFIL